MLPPGFPQTAAASRLPSAEEAIPDQLVMGALVGVHVWPGAGMPHRNNAVKTPRANSEAFSTGIFIREIQLTPRPGLRRANVRQRKPAMAFGVVGAQAR